MKILYLILLVFMLNACDKEVSYDFFVKNDCSATIEVEIVDYKSTSIKRPIQANREILVYTSKGLNKLTEEKVESVFTSIIITKGNDTATHNFINRSEWQMQAASATHANFYLTVDSTDFE
ncbi:MAG: hypothetical protein ACOC10_09485 [Bacteroidota bacterium]